MEYLDFTLTADQAKAFVKALARIRQNDKEIYERFAEEGKITESQLEAFAVQQYEEEVALMRLCNQLNQQLDKDWIDFNGKPDPLYKARLERHRR